MAGTAHGDEIDRQVWLETKLNQEPPREDVIEILRRVPIVSADLRNFAVERTTRLTALPGSVPADAGGYPGVGIRRTVNLSVSHKASCTLGTGDAVPPSADCHRIANGLCDSVFVVPGLLEERIPPTHFRGASLDGSDED
jgi:hypothetical protein